MATYDLATTSPDSIKTGDVLNCPYSGTYKSIKLPEGKYKLEVWGAEGGYRSSTLYSGKGGYSTGVLSISDPKTLYLYSGGSGNSVTASVSSVYPGGFNGGGYRYQYKGGGGSSDIRIESTSLYARVIVAGGGGSDGATSKKGMYGGGVSGGAASENYGSHGYGGTQTANSGSGSYVTTIQPTANSSVAWYNGFGFGGFGCYGSSGYAGAGGGGWYGGCGSYPDGSGDDDRGGGGGSGYIYTSATASSYPSGCLLNASYYLDIATITDGNVAFLSPTGTSETGHSGDGYCRITVIEAKSVDTYLKEGGIWVKQQDVLDVNADIVSVSNSFEVDISGNSLVYRKLNGIWEKVLTNDAILPFSGINL